LVALGTGTSLFAAYKKIEEDFSKGLPATERRCEQPADPVARIFFFQCDFNTDA